jgi:30S ribosomal protein S31
MGKGDKKSKKGKIRLGSWGNSRPRRKKSTATAAVKKTAPKKTAAKKTKKGE